MAKKAYRRQIVCGQTCGGTGGGPGQDVFSSSRTSSLDADDVIDSEMEGLGMGSPDIAKIKKVQSALVSPFYSKNGSTNIVSRILKPVSVGTQFFVTVLYKRSIHEN